MHTSIHGTDEQQGSTGIAQELYSRSCNNLYGKESERKHTHTHMYVCITESLCYTPETL